MMIWHDHESNVWCWCHPCEVDENVWLHWESAWASSRTEQWLKDYSLPLVKGPNDAVEEG